MDIQQIEVFIDPDGTVQIGVQGAKGRSCLELTKALEEALGGDVELRDMTAEALEMVSDEVEDHDRVENR